MNLSKSFLLFSVLMVLGATSKVPDEVGEGSGEMETTAVTDSVTTTTTPTTTMTKTTELVTTTTNTTPKAPTTRRSMRTRRPRRRPTRPPRTTRRFTPQRDQLPNKDTWFGCSQWRRHCNSPRMRDFMRKNCAVTCRFNQRNNRRNRWNNRNNRRRYPRSLDQLIKNIDGLLKKSCNDIFPKMCENMKTRCSDKSFLNFVPTMCRKTCGLCGDTTPINQ